MHVSDQVMWSLAFPPGDQKRLPRLEIFANFLVGLSDFARRGEIRWRVFV